MVWYGGGVFVCVACFVAFHDDHHTIFLAVTGTHRERRKNGRRDKRGVKKERKNSAKSIILFPLSDALSFLPISSAIRAHSHNRPEREREIAIPL